MASMNPARARQKARKALKKLIEFTPRQSFDPFNRKRVFRARKGKGSYARSKVTP
jgi:stalled ribosome alternative rescue factor ArfA